MLRGNAALRYERCTSGRRRRIPEEIYFMEKEEAVIWQDETGLDVDVGLHSPRVVL